MLLQSKQMPKFFYRLFSIGITLTLIFNLVIPPTIVYSQTINLPQPGFMMSMSPPFTPAIVKGLTIYPNNPLKFDFIIDTGNTNLGEEAFREEANKMIKYFLASMTIPEKELWVNLSPYEKGRMIPSGLGATQMGVDLLAQDYMLKQLTASLIYPEKSLGREFWNKIYEKAKVRYGTTDIPLDTFNKVWIIPDKAVVYEHESGAFIGERHLKVMLEEDYLAAQNEKRKTKNEKSKITLPLTAEIIREIIIPAIEKEVNEGQNFANLRQIYNSMILAVWYKKNLRQSLLGQVYADKNKIKGVDIEDKTFYMVEKLFEILFHLWNRYKLLVISYTLYVIK